MTESTAPLRESLRSIGTMVRGFALTFLASVLGVLVTSVLAIFSVVHPALIGVFAGLAVVSLFIVRTLNMRKREIRKRLRRMTGAVTEVEDDADAEAATTSRAAVTAGSTATGAAKTAGSTRSSTVGSTAARAQAMAAAKAAATPRSTASETKASSADEKATTAKTARERALQQRSATAKYAREEAVTGEIPVVRIRNESAEGHTTRQILLTGPIPVIAEPAAVTNAAEKADTTPAETSSPVAAADEASEVVAASTTSVAADLADTVVQRTERSATANSAAEATVNDPFQQRLKARDGWSPTPLPVPSYVGAQEAEHAVPTPKAADASSYETQARSREDIAAQFAEELGYRAELSDSAREDSPLEHGRKAIRADRAPALDAVNDVLARRRA